MASSSVGRPSSPSGPMVSSWLTDLRFSWGNLAHGARTQRFATYETLYLEGQAADAVYLIDEGRVLLTSYGADGKERHLMIIGASGMVGDCGLMASRTGLVSAVAATEVKVSVLPIATLLRALEQNPAWARQHLELSSLRHRIMLQHLALQSSNSARRRVSHHLLGLMNSYGIAQHGGVVISITFTQQEMGNICGLSRVSVNNAFAQLEREGVIGRSGRFTVIHDAGALARIAQT
jgi:CRP/FNR family transcriptional regulator, cyclic AMP receptor protein